jgi:hypothetical protein
MTILLNNMLWEEDIPRQRAPLDNKIYAKLRQMATARKCKDLVSDLLFDVGALGCYIRPRLSKYVTPALRGSNAGTKNPIAATSAIRLIHLDRCTLAPAPTGITGNSGCWWIAAR